LLIAVLSDTHGHLSNAQLVVQRLQELQPKAILHCGDIGGKEFMAMFNAWPTHLVLGNADEQSEVCQASAELDCTFHGWFGEIELCQRHIAMLHGHDRERLRSAIESQQYDLVCFGHRHAPSRGVIGRTLVLNPGALSRAQQPTFATVDLVSMSARLFAVRGD
jgi:putative phosphoesterase